MPEDERNSSPGTQLIRDAKGRSRRQMRAYRLQGGPQHSRVDKRVDLPRWCIGSHEGNDLVIDHPSVSRIHLSIEAGPDGYLARDLESTNGSWVDGLRFREAFLPDRAILRLGEVSLQFEVTDDRADLPSSEQEEFFGVLGRAPAMREVFSQLSRAAPTHATILIEGESGTGKELVASAIHKASERAAGPLVVLDCAAVPSSLLESELFGHERGAFTGAVARSEGRVREADGGTLFLDEVGELPLAMQPKLLRVLETRQVRPLGGTTTHSVDVRLVAATNRDLAREVNRGTFREDLYYRLAVVQVKLPPLRERREDIRVLVRHFLRQEMASEPARAAEILDGISSANWRKLEDLPWPGNIRELRNFIERTLILSGGPIQSQHVPVPAAADPSGTGTEREVDLDRPFSQLKTETIARFERAYLLGQLARHDNNLSAAARASGLDRMNFKRLLRKYR